MWWLGVSGLPLGAKVGITFVLALAAWGVGYRGFGAVLERRCSALQGIGYLAVSLILFGGACLPWRWGGG